MGWITVFLLSSHRLQTRKGNSSAGIWRRQALWILLPVVWSIIWFANYPPFWHVPRIALNKKLNELPELALHSVQVQATHSDFSCVYFTTIAIPITVFLLFSFSSLLLQLWCHCMNRTRSQAMQWSILSKARKGKKVSCQII